MTRGGAPDSRGASDEAPNSAGSPVPGPEGVDPGAFHAVYEGQAPWDIGRPQPEVIHLLEMHRFEGPVLDVGCGTGENAILLAMAGYEVTAIDLVPRAVEMGREAAEERGVAVDWHVGNVLDLPDIMDGRRFATVLDAGLLHVFSDDQRARYAQAITDVTAPAGHLHVIAFSEHEAGPGGPRRVSRRELQDAFTAGWHLDELVEARYHLRDRPGGARAWRGTWRRIGVTTKRGLVAK